MKAIRFSSYGSPDVLRLEEVEKPVPHKKQVLVRVRAASVNAGDWRTIRADPFLIRMERGLLRPKDARVGMDMVGVVEATGEEVTEFRPGDEVLGCARGTFAEYVLARESFLALKPAGVPFETAATLPVAGLTALQGLRDFGEIRAGQKVAIQGASGGVGSFAVQVAKHFGAEVTAICSTRNLEMARSLGADRVIDYTREDFTRERDCYDLIFAANGYHSLWDYKRALKPGGVYACAGGRMKQFFQVMLLGQWMSRGGDKKLRLVSIGDGNQADLAILGELLQTGKLTPVIDRTFPLEETPAAIRYMEEKHARGKVVITVA